MELRHRISLGQNRSLKEIASRNKEIRDPHPPDKIAIEDDEEITIGELRET